MGSKIQVIAFVVFSIKLDKDSRITSNLKLVNIFFIISFKRFSKVLWVKKLFLKIYHTILNPYFKIWFVLSETAYLGNKGICNNEFHISDPLSPKDFSEFFSCNLPTSRIDNGSTAILYIK